MSAWPHNPLIRGAVMQSSDSAHYNLWTRSLANTHLASQPQWQLNSQLSTISRNFSCPTGGGELDCLRKQSGTDLQTVLLATGNQFQPVIDNITIYKDYVKQTQEGSTARIPLLIGTNKVWRRGTSECDLKWMPGRRYADCSWRANRI
jgi:hypothetical protein